MDILDRLEIGYKLVHLTPETLTIPPTSRPLVLVAPENVGYTIIARAITSLGPKKAETLLFINLPNGDGTDDRSDPIPQLALLRPRAACSGYLAPDGKLALANCDVTYFGTDVLAAANFRIVEDALLATQTVLGAEAAALCEGLHVRGDLFCRAIGTAAGSSWVLRNLVPIMLGLGGDSAPGQTLSQAKDSLATALDIAFTENVSSPLTALAAQLFAMVDGEEEGSSAQIHKVWKLKRSPSENNEKQDLPEPMRPTRVGFIGLGAMGFGMANVLRTAGLDVVGYDVYPPAMERYAAEGGVTAASPVEAAKGADVLVLMVVSAEQAANILFEQNAANALAENAVVLLMITSAPSDAVSLSQQLAATRPDARLIDAPVSGSTPRAASGDLTILVGGLEECHLSGGKALHVLQLLSSSLGNTHNLITISGGVGRGMSVKMLNQHQGAAFLMASAEALALAKKLKLPLTDVRALLLRGPAQTWMMWHRGGNMLKGLLQPPSSMVNILNKDLKIVMSEARTRNIALPMLGIVQQQFVLGKANGWGEDDDSSLARLWLSSGIDVRV